MEVAVFTLSVEPVEGATFVAGFHFGTDEAVARAMAEERFHGRNKFGMPTRTVALMVKGKLFDTFDGEWASKREFD